MDNIPLMSATTIEHTGIILEKTLFLMFKQSSSKIVLILLHF